MKNLVGVIALTALCLLVTSIFQPSQATIPSPEPAQSTRPAAATPTRTVLASPVATRTVIGLPPSQTPLPTLFPTIEPTSIPEMLSGSFSVQTQDGINGYELVKITGWSYGFRPSGYCLGPYAWLDQDHLLLFPLTGQEYGMGTVQFSLPVVINHQNGTVWIPSLDGLLELSGCQRPLWSEALNVVIATQGGETLLYTPDGDIIDHYPGGNASLSPSGTKLIAGGVWIDLLSGEQVDFSSRGIHGFSTWASNETELYSCCYAYGNARTGEAYRFELDGLRYVGRDYGAGFRGIRNLWVMNDKYILTHWDFHTDEEQGILPLIEPATGTYTDLRDVTNIPNDAGCVLSSVAPGGEQIWAGCDDQKNYWVDLGTFEVEAFPRDLNLVSWSPDGDFGLMRMLNSEDPPQILSVQEQELHGLTGNPQAGALFWHPEDNILAYLSAEKQALIVVDAHTMSARELPLPATFHELVWNPTGEQLALVAEDGSIWRVDYPEVETLEQLSPALPGVQTVTWSPGGKYIAFVSGADIYLIDTDG